MKTNSIGYNKKVYLMTHVRLLVLGIYTGILSCSPKMHAIGAGMRLLNTSQNKYSKKKPYLNEVKKIKEADSDEK
jgi:hypothetical protein